MKKFWTLMLMLSAFVGMTAQEVMMVDIDMEEEVPVMEDNTLDESTFAKTITVKDLKQHLTTLASDEYEGRRTGTEGQKKAANYIAYQFQQLGLPKVGENSSYFQEIAFSSSRWDNIEMYVGKERFKHLWDFYSFPTTNANRPEYNTKKLLFLGYGIDDANYSDYEGVDVAGKSIIIYNGEPMDAAGKSYVTGSKETSEWTESFRKKLEVAKQKGVATVFIIDADIKKSIGENRRFLLSPRLQMGKAASDSEKYANNAFISSTVAKAMMGKRFKKVVAARDGIKATGQPKAVKLKSKISFAQAKTVKEVIGENVVAYFEGSDPVLKDEIVYITAHYDHLGKTGDDIYNGADDNGSGTSSVLEIVEAFAKAKAAGVSPRRSVVCMLVSGEEMGLLGSEYYVNHPIWPLENAVVDINIDMVGRVDEKYKDNPNYVYVIGSDRLSTDLHDVNEKMNERHTNLTLDYTYNADDDPNRYYYRSDHYNFAEKGIPSIFYFNGTHADYHRTTDTVDKINFEKMEIIAKLAFHVAWEVANRTDRLRVNVTGRN